MRVLIVTNMYPSERRPARGRFVYDQVEGLRRLEGVEVEVFAFGDGGSAGYPAAARALRKRYGGTRFDVVHSHFGLTVWPALGARAAARAVTLHGTDLAHPRSRAITLAGLRLVDLVATVSGQLAASVPALAVRGRSTAVLPCGVDMGRFRRIDRAAARGELGLHPDARYLLFPADPARAEKRYDRALEVAREIPLLTLGEVAPTEVPLWVNAADAVLVPSEREGFGLAVLEALSCDVPVLATPVGIAPETVPRVAGCHCGPFDIERWSSALDSVLASADPRVEGRAVAEEYSADRMAARVLEAWRAL